MPVNRNPVLDDAENPVNRADEVSSQVCQTCRLVIEERGFRRVKELHHKTTIGDTGRHVAFQRICDVTLSGRPKQAFAQSLEFLFLFVANLILVTVSGDV